MIIPYTDDGLQVHGSVDGNLLHHMQSLKRLASEVASSQAACNGSGKLVFCLNHGPNWNRMFSQNWMRPKHVTHVLARAGYVVRRHAVSSLESGRRQTLKATLQAQKHEAHPSYKPHCSSISCLVDVNTMMADSRARSSASTLLLIL